MSGYKSITSHICRIDDPLPIEVKDYFTAAFVYQSAIVCLPAVRLTDIV